MSRIGERNIVIPQGTNVSVDNGVVLVKGPKGELTLNVSPLIDVQVSDGVVKTSQKKVSKLANIMQGTTNSLISGMVTGVSTGFEKGLEAVGVGYRFNVQGNKITVNAGYSHPVELVVPEGLKVEMPDKSTTELTISGYDKQLVSEFAANVRKVRQPEPYKGKGIKYKDEHIRRKEGKKAA